MRRLVKAHKTLPQLRLEPQELALGAVTVVRTRIEDGEERADCIHLTRAVLRSELRDRLLTLELLGVRSVLTLPVGRSDLDLHLELLDAALRLGELLAIDAPRLRRLLESALVRLARRHDLVALRADEGEARLRHLRPRLRRRDVLRLDVQLDHRLAAAAVCDEDLRLQRRDRVNELGPLRRRGGTKLLDLALQLGRVVRAHLLRGAELLSRGSPRLTRRLERLEPRSPPRRRRRPAGPRPCAERAHVRIDGDARIDRRRVRGDVARARRVLERGERRAEVHGGGLDGGDHQRVRVAAEGVGEEARELVVAVRHGDRVAPARPARVLRERLQHVAQRRERDVDRARLRRETTRGRR